MHSEKDRATLETLVLNKKLLKEKISGMLGVDQRNAPAGPMRWEFLFEPVYYEQLSSMY